MNNTKIEWCDSTWNPVTGCLHDCEYCYARKIANRFGTIDKMIKSATEEGIDLGSTYFRNPDYFSYLNEPVHDENNKVQPFPTNFYPTFHRYRLNEPNSWKKSKTIFVCSMADLFGDWIPDEWIAEVFKACEKAPQHNYLFLTKNPKRYVELHHQDKLPIESNMWYGASATTPRQLKDTVYSFGKMPVSPQQANTFLSVEPILADITKYQDWESIYRGWYIDWIIVGAETGNRKEKVVPHKEWIDNIVKDCDEYNIPVFMKDSLIPIVGEENMRHEFPWKTNEAYR